MSTMVNKCTFANILGGESLSVGQGYKKMYLLKYFKKAEV